MAIESFFCESPKVVAEASKTHKHIDFYINTIPFDHKTSVFPKGFQHNLDYAKSNERQLISWFYEQQSTQQRQHFKNRIFVVVHAKDGQHWKLKAQLTWLQSIVKSYLDTFSEDRLHQFMFEAKPIKAGIIWAVD